MLSAQTLNPFYVHFQETILKSVKLKFKRVLEMDGD